MAVLNFFQIVTLYQSIIEDNYLSRALPCLYNNAMNSKIKTWLPVVDNTDIKWNSVEDNGSFHLLHLHLLCTADFCNRSPNLRIDLKTLM